LGPRPRYELKPLLSRKDSWSLGARNFQEVPVREAFLKKVIAGTSAVGVNPD
jgi:hypothetical protein